MGLDNCGTVLGGRGRLVIDLGNHRLRENVFL